MKHESEVEQFQRFIRFTQKIPPHVVVAMTTFLEWFAESDQTESAKVASAPD